jgi:hypothetical protein
MERGVSGHVFRLHVRLVGQQELGNLAVTALAGHVQRSPAFLQIS